MGFVLSRVSCTGIEVPSLLLQSELELCIGLYRIDAQTEQEANEPTYDECVSNLKYVPVYVPAGSKCV